MTSKLAIVIPAYKSQYLRETLLSISAQTNKDFTVYIGDDCSPNDLKLIVDDFENILNIRYKRFDSNLGGQNLVRHWNRCIAEVRDESWIWLFSDDDTMDPNCVECFYKTTVENPDAELLHFNVSIIDHHTNVFKICNNFNSTLDTSSFFLNRITYQLDSFVVEYIIKRSHFYLMGEFDEYDLAWSADDAAWIKFGSNKGILTIVDARVYWRLSSLNISSFQGDIAIIDRKLQANIKYLDWAKRYFIEKSIKDYTSSAEKFKWVFRITARTKLLSFRRKVEIAFTTIKLLGYRSAMASIFTYVIFEHFKSTIRNFKKS